MPLFRRIAVSLDALLSTAGPSSASTISSSQSGGFEDSIASPIVIGDLIDEAAAIEQLKQDLELLSQSLTPF
jgi:hypothetical protein